VTLDELRPRLLSEAPALPLKPARSDYDFDPSNRPPQQAQLTPAAVLLPIVMRAEPTVLFTERSARLAQHAGQVSFPGGRAEPTDESLIRTALRETQEETGIDASFISIAGFLEAYETGTGFAILPVVGLLKEGFALVPNTDEVAEIFEVPLAFLLDPANRQKEQAEWKGRVRHYYAFRYNGHYIWGATAAMLVNFADRMKA
jgi:8-oxo-dGTP pyrophosphatase MutT (NUDIX family)